MWLGKRELLNLSHHYAKFDVYRSCGLIMSIKFLPTALLAGTNEHQASKQLILNQTVHDEKEVHCIIPFN